MADGVLANISGLRELNNALATLSDQQRRNITRAGVSAGARVIVNAAKAEALGNVPPAAAVIIARAIVQKRIPELCTPTREVAYVTVRKGKRERKKGRDGWFWHFFEFGTKAHVVEATNAKKILADKEKGVFYGPRVFIPYMAATPFMRPAFDAQWQAAVDAMRQRWEIRIHALARQAPK